MVKTTLKVIGVFLVGALGALVFTFFGLPYMAASVYFKDYPFVKDYKEGKILVNKTEQIYIQENTSIEASIEKVKPSIVAIQTGNALWSGFIVTSDGSIITLASAINSASHVYVAGQAVDFSIIKTDKLNNVALIKIDKSSLQTVAFADISKIKLGQRVFLVAPTSSIMNNWLANEGIVRQIGANSIQTNIIEKPVTAGGPIFNSVGELMGLNVLDADGKISIIPINKIQSLLGL